MTQKSQLRITEKLKEKCNTLNQFARFDNLFRAVVSVPKTAIDNEEAKWKRRKKHAKNQAHRPKK